MIIDNDIRAFFYIAGILKNQQHDPFCGMCKAYVNSANAARERVVQLGVQHAAEIQVLSPHLQKLLGEAKEFLNNLVLDQDVPGQKKAGNCKLPPGTCLVKYSIALLKERIQMP